MQQLAFALDLRDDAHLIAEYEEWHRPDRIWPEIVQSLQAAGITELRIFRTGTRLFLLMEAPDDFSPETRAAADADNPHVQAWERLMWKYQQALPGAAPGQKWMAMKPIFSLRECLPPSCPASSSSTTR